MFASIVVLLLFFVTALDFPLIGQQGYFFEIVRCFAPYLLILWSLVAIFSFVFVVRSKKRFRSLLVFFLSLGCIVHLALPLEMYYHPAVKSFHKELARRYHYQKPQKVYFGYEDNDLFREQLKDRELVSWIILSNINEIKGWCHQEVTLDDGQDLTVGSRPPCRSDAVLPIGDDLPPVIKIELQTPGKPLPLFFFRSVEMNSADDHRTNHIALRRLTTRLRHMSDFVAIVSLHANQWSDYYSRVTYGSEAFDFDWGRGIRFGSTDYALARGRVITKAIIAVGKDSKDFVIEFSLSLRGSETTPLRPGFEGHAAAISRNG